MRIGISEQLTKPITDPALLLPGSPGGYAGRGDIDAVAHQVAVALLDHIAEMDADAKLNAALGRQASITFDHTVLGRASFPYW